MGSEHQAISLTHMAEHSSDRIIPGTSAGDTSSRSSREPQVCKGFAVTDETGGSMTTADMAITDADCHCGALRGQSFASATYNRKGG